MNLGMLSKYNRILHTSTGLSARINVTRGAAAQWCSRRRLISAGIGDSRALGASSRAVSRPFARPTRSSQARCARPDRPQEGFPSTLMGCFPAQGSHAGGECSCTPCRRCSRSSRRCEIAFWFSIWYLLVVLRRAPLPTLLGLFVHDDP